MLNISRSGLIADVIRDMRDVPALLVPYAAAAALTKVASEGREALIAEMPRVFDRPNRWTLNSIRVVPAKAEALSARVMVKDDAPRNGTRPEDYLLPSVLGGGRNEKRFERHMRYAGILRRGEWVQPGVAAPLDAHGNLTRGEIMRILTATRSAFDPAQNKTGSRRSRANARNAPYFYADIRGTRGIWRRSGRVGPGSARPVLVFTNTAPTYRKRLDFDGIAERVVRERFPVLFRGYVTSIRAKKLGPQQNLF